MINFSGTGVAIVTPFLNNGNIDFPRLKNLINFVIDGGVNYIVSMGTTGESVTLTKEEKQEVWKFTAEAVDKKIPLVAGIGGNCTADIVNATKKFHIEGFDAILSVSPYYNKPSQEGIYQHYQAIADVASLPIMIYNVPGRTGSNISAETTLRLATTFKNIIATKDASGNFDQYNQILKDKPESFLLISGDDPITLPMMAMGADGVISVAANAVPHLVSKMVDECAAGRFDSARPYHLKLIDLIGLLFAEGNPAGVKAALKAIGMCESFLRLPLVPASEALSISINKVMDTLTKNNI